MPSWPIRTDVDNVKTYFDSKASTYTASSKKLAWKWQRLREGNAIDSMIGDISGQHILDLGCGSGHYTRHCLKRGARKITAVDFSPNMVSSLPSNRVDGIVCDVNHFSTESKFDLIICAGLLEFVKTPEKTLKNARKMIANDGAMICLFPPKNIFGMMYKRFHEAHGFDINLYKKGGFVVLSDLCGWSIERYISLWPYTVITRLKPK